MECIKFLLEGVTLRSVISTDFGFINSITILTCVTLFLFILTLSKKPFVLCLSPQVGLL